MTLLRIPNSKSDRYQTVQPITGESTLKTLPEQVRILSPGVSQPKYGVHKIAEYQNGYGQSILLMPRSAGQLVGQEQF